MATLAELRQFAKAREWVIVDVILDTTPLSTPLDKRPMWRSVREAIAEGQAEGIVAAQGHTCDDVDDTRAQLSNWLAEHAAFLTTARCGVRSSHTAERSQL